MAELENDFDEIARKRIANLLSKNEGEIRVYLRLLDMVRRIDDKLDIATEKPMSPEFWKKVRDFAMTELKSKKIITFLRPTGYEEVKQESQG